jgi:hypothetical protein
MLNRVTAELGVTLHARSARLSDGLHGMTMNLDEQIAELRRGAQEVLTEADLTTRCS